MRFLEANKEHVISDRMQMLSNTQIMFLNVHRTNRSVNEPLHSKNRYHCQQNKWYPQRSQIVRTRKRVDQHKPPPPRMHKPNATIILKYCS